MTTVSTEPTAIGANDQDLASGSVVGEYRVEGVLGKGGFGTVYSAVQPVIGKQVAIKVLARKYSADPAIVSRFVAEARAVNQIRHRNIIDIFSFGQLEDGRHYYVMEHMEGETLDAYVKAHGPVPLADALPIMRAIARALDAAHAKGIAHRDLKPENIFLARDAEGAIFPKLLDFGIAKLLVPDDDVRHKTNTGVPLGTPYYMSPEQCRGKDVDHRTDIYSFGIVAYKVLTGRFPFEGDDYMDLLIKQTNDEAVPPSTHNPDLPPSVDAAIAWMMRKDRAQRPPTVIEAVGALDPTQTITAPAHAPLARGSKPTVPPKVVTGDALAATFTPEFERPELPAVTLPPQPITTKRSPVVMVGAITIVLLAATVALLLAMKGGTEPPPKNVEAKDPPVVTPPPVAQPPAPTPAPVVETKVETPAAVVETKPAVAPVGTKKVNKKATATTTTTKTQPATGSATAPTDPAEPQDKSRDTIHLGSDAFK